MINYGRQSINKKDIGEVVKVLKSNFLTQGPMIEKFEKRLKKYFKCKNAIAVSSGTAALNLISKALKWKNKDYIVVSPITFLSSVNCILQNNSKPYFIDINMRDFSIDISKLEIALNKYKKKIKAVIITDYAGHPADWKRLNVLKKKHKFTLINDNCHSMGSSFNNNYGYAAKYADYVSLSFHPVKNFTTGEGGAVLTNDSNKAKLIKSLRSHGVVRSSIASKKYGQWYYEMNDIGDNYRMSDIHAALGFSQISRLNKFVKKRNKIAKFYDKLFSDKSKFIIPSIKKNCTHSYHLYPLLINFKKIKKSKKRIFNEFLKKNIKLQVHYIPVNSQPYYKKLIKLDRKKFLNSFDFYKREISMPIYYDLSNNDLNHIKMTCKKVFNI